MATGTEIIAIFKNIAVKQRMFPLDEFAVSYIDKQKAKLDLSKGSDNAKLGFLYCLYKEYDLARNHFAKAMELNCWDGYAGLCELIQKDAFVDKKALGKFTDSLLKFVVDRQSYYGYIVKGHFLLEQYYHSPAGDMTFLDEAEEYFKKAYKAGLIEGAWEVFLIYEKLRQESIFSFDHTKSYPWLKICYEANYIPALNYIATALDNEDNDFYNPRKAFEFAKYCADTGYEDSYGTLARYYDAGTGCKTDGAKAAEYYLRNAKGGYRYDTTFGGDLALFGKNMDGPNYSLALECYKLGYKLGDIDDGIKLAYMSYHSLGCKKDMNLILKILRDVNKHDNHAKNLLAILSLKGEANDFSHDEAANILHYGSYSQDFIVSLEYFHMLVEGKLIPQDLRAAHYVLKRIYETTSYIPCLPVSLEVLKYIQHPFIKDEFTTVEELKKARDGLLNNKLIIPTDLLIQVNNFIEKNS